MKRKRNLKETFESELLIFKILWFWQTLGIPLDVAARLQLNVLIRPVEGVSMYADVPEVYFPIMW